MNNHAELRAALDQTCHALLIDDPDTIRALLAERDALREALEAAMECGMVPSSSVKDGGANRYVRQAQVADMIRAALAQGQGERDAA